MSYTEKFSVGESYVGYIIRGRPLRLNPDKVPPLDDARHADCILPGAKIAGFCYGDEYYDASKLRQATLKGLDGSVVIGEEAPEYYRNSEKARAMQLHSTFLLFKAPSHQAQALTNFWMQAKSNTPSYNRVWKNCSSVCYQAFVSAGLLSSGMIHRVSYSVMTPKRLYQILLEKYSQPDTNLIVRTGYFGCEGNNVLVIPGELF